MKKIGFIGTGNIARAMMTGLIKSGYDVTDIYVSAKVGEIWPKSKEKFAEDFGCKCAENNIDLVQRCDVVITALAPDVYKYVAPEILEYIKEGQIFISTAPNFSFKEMKEVFGDKIKAVRVIPNTPVTVAQGMSGMSFDKEKFTDEEKQMSIDFFSNFSRVEVLEEQYVDMIPTMSGSAPAYMYMLLEAMADAAAIIGFPREEAYIFASQAMIGSATMVLETGKHPCELKDTVCTPGGTTVEAIKVFENENYKGTIVKAMLACFDKSHKLK